ncbi:MAG: hypothetical protein V4466_14605 [Pseudomonadota bacterium]
MAEKSRGGGGFLWFVLGIAVGIAMTLAALMFMNSGPVGDDALRTAADDAAASVVEAPAEPAQLPAPVTAAPEPAQTAPGAHDAGIDPAGDDQIADDAAAAGMTSRPPSTEGE